MFFGVSAVCLLVGSVSSLASNCSSNLSASMFDIACLFQAVE